MASTTLSVVSGAAAAALDTTPLPKGQHCRVLFVYPNSAGLTPYHLRQMMGAHVGLMGLSACVRQIGGETALCDLTIIPESMYRASFDHLIDRFRPDLVAITATTVTWPVVRRVIGWCRELQVPHVIGGPHVSVAPENVIEHADAVVLGEGEGAIMDIARAVAARRSWSGIANSWVRDAKGVVHRAPKRDLIPDLDALPMPDWSLFPEKNHRYYMYPDTVPRGQRDWRVRATLEGSRGCPYRCTYCTNGAMMDQYKGRGKWRREKTVTRLMAELQDFRQTFGTLERVTWVDEVFMTTEQRVAEFCAAYREHIGVPMAIQERPEFITESRVRMMAQAGLAQISIGLESGDAAVRSAVLKRPTDDATVERAFRIPRRYGIRTKAFHMVGLPDQDERSLLKTWKTLRAIQADRVSTYVFQPLPGTELYDRCIKSGAYDGRPINAFSKPIIAHQHMTDEHIARYRRLFDRYGPRPNWRTSLAFHLARRSTWWCQRLVPTPQHRARGEADCTAVA